MLDRYSNNRSEFVSFRGTIEAADKWGIKGNLYAVRNIGHTDIRSEPTFESESQLIVGAVEMRSGIFLCVSV